MLQKYINSTEEVVNYMQSALQLSFHPRMLEYGGDCEVFFRQYVQCVNKDINEFRIVIVAASVAIKIKELAATVAC